MTNPVPIPVGPLTVTSAQITAAEALVAAIAQVIEYGTSVGSTPATLTPSGGNTTSVSALVLDTAQKQLFYRQLAMALATWTSGGGGGTSLTFTASGSGSVFVGNAVAVSSGNTVQRADATNAAKVPAVGIVTLIAGSVITVQTSGLVTGLSGLTPGATYFVGTGGALVMTLPTPGAIGSGIWYAQPLGVALNATTLLLSPAADIVQYSM